MNIIHYVHANVGFPSALSFDFENCNFSNIWPKDGNSRLKLFARSTPYKKCDSCTVY